MLPEQVVISSVAFVQTMIAVVEIHPCIVRQSRFGFQCLKRGGVPWQGLRHVLEGGREAYEIPKDTWMQERGVKGIERAEPRTAECAALALCNGSIVLIHVRHKLGGDELRIGRPAKLG